MGWECDFTLLSGTNSGLKRGLGFRVGFRVSGLKSLVLGRKKDLGLGPSHLGCRETALSPGMRFPRHDEP